MYMEFSCEFTCVFGCTFQCHIFPPCENFQTKPAMRMPCEIKKSKSEVSLTSSHVQLYKINIGQD